MPARPRFALEELEGRITPVSFAGSYGYGVGGNASSVAAEDINGDGALDLAVSTAEGMTVYLNDGTGHMTFSWGSGGGNGSIKLVDMNGDGKRDIIVSNGTGASFRLLLGNGDGTFQAATIYPSVSTVQSLEVGDMNGDGRPDVVCSIPGGIVIRLNNGSASILGDPVFATSNPVPDGLGVVLGDMNGDGYLDVIQAGYSSNRVYVYLNNGNGALVTTSNTPVGAGTHSSSLAVADFDNDGKLDVATTIPGNSTVGILRGNGNGTLQAPVAFGSNSAGTLTTADFDLDGNADLAVNSYLGSRVFVYLGDGAGGFGTGVQVGSGVNPSGLITADINGDSLPDIVTTGTTSPGSVVISLNTTSVNFRPVITSNGGGTTASVSVSENTTAVTTVTATDATVPAQTLTYSISGGADAGKFTIDGSTGVLAFVAPPDFETPTDVGSNNVYNVTVQVSDGAGGTDTQAIAVTVTGLNDNLPVITSNGGGAIAAVSVAENTTAVTTVTATDADLPAQTRTYSIAGGADANRFTIDGSTGVVSFQTAPNFETPTDNGGDNVYDVIVQVSDGNGGTDTQALAVTVTNANETAQITGISTGSVTEDGVLSTGGTLTVADPDVGQSTFQVPPNLAGAFGTFTFSATTGAWTYTLTNGLPAVQALGAGQTLTDTLAIMSLDGTATRTLTVTINGAAEPLPPVVPILPPAPVTPYYTGATMVGSVLTLQGSGVSGGATAIPLPPQSVAFFTDINGDGSGDVVLILPGLILVLNGQTGQPMLLLTIAPNGIVTRVI